MPLPAQGDANATQFAGIEMYSALIQGRIMDTMWNQLALAGTWEIMIQSFDSRLDMAMTFTAKVAKKLSNNWRLC